MKLFLDKFVNAIRGLFEAIKDTSVQLQVGIAIVAIVLGFFFDFNMMEWCILLLCCSIVIISEMINSCFENLLDFVHPDYHEKVGNIKDKGAGFVLFASLSALVIGLILFGSKLL